MVVRSVIEEKQIVSELVSKLHSAKANKRMYRNIRRAERVAAKEAHKGLDALIPIGKTAASSLLPAGLRVRRGGGSISLTLKGEFRHVLKQESGAADAATAAPFVPPAMNSRRRRRAAKRAAEAAAAGVEDEEVPVDTDGAEPAQSYRNGLVAWAGSGASKCIVRLRSSLDVRHTNRPREGSAGAAAQASAAADASSTAAKKKTAKKATDGSAKLKKAKKRRAKRTAKKSTAIITNQKDAGAFAVSLMNALRRDFQPLMKKDPIEKGGAAAGAATAGDKSSVSPTSSPSAAASKQAGGKKGGAAATAPSKKSGKR